MVNRNSVTSRQRVFHRQCRGEKSDFRPGEHGSGTSASLAKIGPDYLTASDGQLAAKACQLKYLTREYELR